MSYSSQRRQYNFIMLLSISTSFCAFTNFKNPIKQLNQSFALIHFSLNIQVHIGTGHCQLKEQRTQPMYHVKAINENANTIKCCPVLMTESKKYQLC